MSALEVESLLQKMAALRGPNGDWPRGVGFEFEELYAVLKKIYAEILRAEALVIGHRTSAVYSVFTDELRLVAFSVDDALHKFSSGTSFSSFAMRSLYHMLRGGAGGSRMPRPVPVLLVGYAPMIFAAQVLVKALVPLVDHTVEVALRPKIAKQFQEAQRDLQMMLRLFSTYVVDLLPKHQEVVAPSIVWNGSFTPLRGLIGRDEDMENILKALDAGETEVVTVVGMAGVGKTAFISEVCRKYAAKHKGAVYQLWVHVSQNFDTEMIFQGLMTSLSEWEPDKDPESYWWCMKEGLVNQKYLVVLDDVWNEDSCKWNQLLQLLRGKKTLENKIIVTTRIPAVAAAIQSVRTHKTITTDAATIQSVKTHNVNLLPLSIEASQELLRTISKDNFFRENYNEYGFKGSITRHAAERCSGLPELVYLLDSFQREGIFQRGAMYEVEAFDKQCMGDKGLLNIARASYNHLPSHLQRCFLYCSLFPLDHVFDLEELSALCVAEGLTQDSSREAQVDGDLSKLLAECFETFYESGSRGKMRYKMQFIMHNFARIEGENLYKAIKVEYTNWTGQSIPYMSLMVDRTTKILPKSLIEQKDLRTLILHRKQDMVLCCQRSEIKDIPSDYCLYLKALRVLDLHATRIKSLPAKFHMLSNLRYLNLSQTDIATLPDFFDELQDLIYLNISQTRIEQVPDTIGKIRSLRYLNLSETGVRNLPRTFGGLRSLQTLQLSHCKKLVKLSQNIALLTNLQKLDLEGCHCLTEMPLDISTMKKLKELNLLECSSLQRMPIGLTSLTKIEALPRYIVTKPNSKAILELQGLKNLKILGLDNVDKISTKDAKKIQLHEMKKLENLALHCSKDGKSTSTSVVESIFDNLKPNCGLKALEITRYAGERFPTWMSDEHRQLKNLADLRLIKLKCESLQVLGLLPCLTNLEICGMDAITKFGKESNQKVLTFHSLKKLTFSQMLYLESWPEDGANCNCLEELSVIQCPKFEELSMKLHIKKLNVCMSPHKLFSKEGLAGLANSTTLKSLSISLCEELSSSSNVEGLKVLSSLKKLEISGCDELKTLPPGLVENLASLKTLSIARCSKLHRLFAPSDSSNQTFMHSSSLEELAISGCEKLESLFLDVEGLASLKRLLVTGCIKLCDSTGFGSGVWMRKSASEGQITELETRSRTKVELQTVASFRGPWLWQHIRRRGALPNRALLRSASLESLRIFDCPNVGSLLHLSSIEVLEIYGHDKLESLPQGVVDNLPSLMSLSVLSCRRLKDVSCLRNCTSLRSLRISDCPNLTGIPERLKRIMTRE